MFACIPYVYVCVFWTGILGFSVTQYKFLKVLLKFSSQPVLHWVHGISDTILHNIYPSPCASPMCICVSFGPGFWDFQFLCTNPQSLLNFSNKPVLHWIHGISDTILHNTYIHVLMRPLCVCVCLLDWDFGIISYLVQILKVLLEFSNQPVLHQVHGISDTIVHNIYPCLYMDILEGGGSLSGLYAAALGGGLRRNLLQ